MTEELDILQAWLIISKHLNVGDIHIDAEESNDYGARILSNAIFALDEHINPAVGVDIKEYGEDLLLKSDIQSDEWKLRLKDLLERTNE